MTRILVLGATGTVGRQLVPLLAANDEHQLHVTGRNAVLLEHLAQIAPVEPHRFEAATSGASALPEADLVIDLTFSLNRHPRWVVQAAERSIGILVDYLRLHPHARAVHTGTFALVTARPQLASALSDRLVWDGTYLLAKSAQDRAIRRHGPLPRLRVLRLGNMAVADMLWTTAILRAVKCGAVANSEALSRAANLSGARQLARALVADGPQLSYLDGLAGFTWGEAINAVADATGQPRLEYETVSTDGARAGRLGPLLRRGLYAAPLSMATGPMEGLPGAQLWLSAGRRIVRSANAARAPFPVALPIEPPMPGARRDEDGFTELVEDLAEQCRERGWTPLAAGA